MAMGLRTVVAALLLGVAAGQPEVWGTCDPADCLDVQLLWTSRLEGRYLPVTSSGAPCDPDAAAKCFAGAARRVAYVEQARNASAIKNQSVVFLDLGGSTFGGPLNGHPDFPFGVPEAMLRNLTPYDVCAFGPRDFLASGDAKARTEMAASYATHGCPTVLTNAQLTGPWEAFSNKTQKYVVKTMLNGWKVAFFGMMSYSPGLGYLYGNGVVKLDSSGMLGQILSGVSKYLRLNPAVLRAQIDQFQVDSERMDAYPADVFTLSTTMSVDTLAAVEQVRQAVPDVKALVLIVPGNTREDEVMWMAEHGPFDVLLRESWPALGVVPTLVRSAVYNKSVLIAGCETLTGLGALHARLRLGRGLERFTFLGNVPLNASVPAKPEVQKAMSALYNFTRQRNAHPYGMITTPLTGGFRGEAGPSMNQCYWTDCPASNAIGRGLLWKARSLGHRADISLTNLGGLRAPLTGDANRTVFMSHCLATQSFQNIVALYHILGKDLLANLQKLMVPQERGLMSAGLRVAFHEPCFGYVNHTNYTFEASGPPGQLSGLARCAADRGPDTAVRIIDAQVQMMDWDSCKDYTACDKFVWQQLQKGTTYTLVSTTYLQGQLVGFKPLEISLGTDTQALCDYIASSTPLAVDSWEAFRDRGKVQYRTPAEGWAAGNRVPSVKASVPVLDGAPTCPDGMYLPDGALSCLECPPGTHSTTDASRDVCVPCELGFFTNDSGVGRCTACAAGSFAERAASTVCEPCAPGTFSDVGAIYCNVCKPGSYAAAAGSDGCLLCDVGRFAEDSRATACLDCRAGLVTRYPGARSAGECICPAGSYRPLGGGNSSDGAAPGATCLPCPEGMACDAGSDMRNYEPGAEHVSPGPYPTLVPGFWAEAGEPLSVFRCASERLCPGGDPGTCATGETTGLCCASCEPRYYPTPMGCRACRGADTMPMIAAFIAAAILAALLASIGTGDTDSTRFSLMTVVLTAGQLVCTVQMMGVFKGFKVQWLEPLASLMNLAGLVAFNIDLLRPACFVGKDSVLFVFLIRLLCIPILAILLGLVMAASALRKGRLHFDCDQFHNSLGLLFVMLYVSITVSMVDPLQCRVHPNGKSSMSSNLALLCWETAEHRALVAMSVVGFACYPLAMLARVAFATWRYPAVVASGGGLRLLKRFRFLFARYRPECHFWGFWYLLRNLVLPLIPVVVPSEALWQIFLAGLLLHSCCYFQASCFPWRTILVNYSETVTLVGLLVFIQTASFLSAPSHNADGAEVSNLLFAILIVTLAGAVGIVLWSILRHIRPGKKYTMFLSHHKDGAGSLARWFKLQLTSTTFNATVFLDSDELDNLDLLVEIVRSRTKNFVLLLTRMTLTRVWCAAEIATAKACKVKIVMVTCCDYEPPDDTFIRNLALLWSKTQEQLLLQYGVTMFQVRKAYEHLETLPAITLDRFDPIEQQVDAVNAVLRSCNFASGKLSKGASPTLSGTLLNMLTSTSEVGGRMNGNQSTRQLPSEKTQILVLGASDDAEARSTCEVLRMLLEKKAGVTATAVFTAGQAEGLMWGVEFLLVVLTRGLLHDPGFSEIGPTYMDALKRRASPIDIVVALADSNFPFPAPDFYDALEKQMPSQAAFLRKIFHVLAVPFSPHGGARIIDVQVEQLCRRLQHQWTAKPSTDFNVSGALEVPEQDNESEAGMDGNLSC